MVDNQQERRDRRLRHFFLSLIDETRWTSWELIRITIPVAILTKIFEELGAIAYISSTLEPVMGLIGLPGSLGLVWATAMFTNLYGGIAVFAALAPSLDLTAAQVTGLCSAMLIAHALPVELAVSRRAGARILPIAVIRVFGAFVYACLLNWLSLVSGIWQDPAPLLFRISAAQHDIWHWGVNLLMNQGLIIVIIFCIILFMRFFRAIGLLGQLERLLAPVLPFFGMGGQAAPLTVVGMIMGISYGGALIIRETTTGKLRRDEIFNSMALMGMCHGLVEDTLVMAAIGGKFGGILWGRIFFSLLVSYMLVKACRTLTIWKGGWQGKSR